MCYPKPSHSKACLLVACVVELAPATPTIASYVRIAPLSSIGAEAVPQKQLPTVREIRLYAEMLQRKRAIESVHLLAPPDWGAWSDAMFGHQSAGYAPHHCEFWEWVWSIEAEVSPAAYVGIWARGGAKSTNAERAVVALGARNRRGYCLYVSGTQEQADKHVASIGAILEGRGVSKHYPELGQRKVGKYGNSQGWRRNRLRTATGFTIDALGLDVAARGIRVDELRPDLMVFDDIDERDDSKEATDKKERQITQNILPAGTNKGLAVLFIQNLIHEDSIAARLVNGRANYLNNRIVSGPIPALYDFAYEVEEWPSDHPRAGAPRFVISAGSPSWQGQDLVTCQQQIDTNGITAFLNESQHDVQVPEGGLFSHLSYRHIAPQDVPDFVACEVWVDPAVTSKDSSDSHGIACGGIDIEGNVYFTYAWEGITSPRDSIERAIRLGVKMKARSVGIETDQGGDLWEERYYEIAEQWTKVLGEANRPPPFTSAKAGEGHGSKVHRATMMMQAYESGKILHVIDPDKTYVLRERALKRFPKQKPFDLVDAHYWLWWSLTQGYGLPNFF